MKHTIHMRYRSSRNAVLRLWQLVCLLGLLSWGSLALAQAVGVVTHLSGILTAKHLDGSTAVLAVKSQIQQGDTLITESNTFTRVKFLDNAEIVLRPGTKLVVKSYLYDADKPAQDNVAISLVKGGMRAVTGLVGKRNHDAVNFETPTATIGIRGTNFGALFCQNDCGGVPNASGNTPPNGLYIDVSQGRVLVSNPAGQQLLESGQFGFVLDIKTPPVPVPPALGVPVKMPLSISRNVPPVPQSSNGKDVDCIVQ